MRGFSATHKGIRLTGGVGRAVLLPRIDLVVNRCACNEKSSETAGEIDAVPEDEFRSVHRAVSLSTLCILRWFTRARATP